MRIELLESRIAPAAVFVNSKTATFLDGDGDAVRVTFSKAILTATNVDDVFIENGNGLEKLDLTAIGAAAKGTNVTLTVTKRAFAGDGHANVGFINAAGIDLGVVSLVKSDLGKIVAGDGKFVDEIFTDPTKKVGAIKTLIVSSLGILGNLTQGGASDFKSVFNGAVGTLLVNLPQGISADLKSEFNGAVGALLVNRSVYGAQLEIHGKAGAIGIGGNVYGGSAPGQGSITVDGHVNIVSIGGDLIGGSGAKTGFLRLAGECDSVYIGGSIRGNSGDDSGGIIGSVYRITIGGDIRGGDVTEPGQVLTHSGFIISPTTEVLTVRGSMIAGSNDTATGTSVLNASVAMQTGRLKPSIVTISGSMIGNVGKGGFETSPTIETAASAGQTLPTIGKLTVKGDMIHATVLGGYFNSVPFPVNPGTSLGAITIGGDFIASSIVTCVGKGPDGKFGGGDDTFEPGVAVNPAMVKIAKIASIVIKGNIVGDQTGAGYAIAAEHIAKLTVGGAVIPLIVGKSNDALSIGFGANVFIEEVSRSA